MYSDKGQVKKRKGRQNMEERNAKRSRVGKKREEVEVRKKKKIQAMFRGENKMFGVIRDREEERRRERN